MATYINPTGAFQGGTEEADTFIFDVPLTSSILVDAVGGFDRLVVDRSADEASQFRANDNFNSGTFYITVQIGPYGAQLTAFQFEDIEFTGSALDDSFELTIASNSSALLVDYDGGAGTDYLFFDFSKLSTGITFRLENGVITSSFGHFANIERFNIQAGAGNDVILTGDLADIVYAGGGSDDIRTGGGSDSVYAETGGDYIDMGTGDYDSFQGNYSATAANMVVNLGETVTISNGVTILNADRVHLGTGSGDDQINITHQSAGMIYGGAGVDTLSYVVPLVGPQSFTVQHSNGTLSGAANQSTFAEMERVFFQGGASDDEFQVFGGFQSWAINFDGGGGSDLLRATFTSLSGANQFIVAADGTVNTNRGTFTGFERFQLSGGEQNDVFVTGAGNDMLYGVGGDDRLEGGAGNDGLAGSSGNDYLDAGAGNDSLWGDAGDDVLVSGSGDDLLYGYEGADRLVVSGVGVKEAQGGLDVDTLVVDYGDAVTAITMSAPVSEPGGGYAGTIGDGGARSLTYSGIELFNITTGSGNDVVRGGGSTAALPGIVSNQYSLGAGDDLFYSMGGTDTVDAGTGVDGFSGTLGTAGEGVFWSLQPTALPGVHNTYVGFEYFLSLTTGSGQDNITTANLALNDNVVLGTNGDSVILWNGHDTVNGGAAGAGATDSGLDTLILNYGSATGAVLTSVALTSNAAGYSGQYSDGASRSATFQAIDRFLIATGTGADVITTGNGNDDIRTFGGSDTINSGAGNDFLDGGIGDDIMNGGAGNDVYAVGSAGDLVVEAAGEGIDEVRTALATYVLAAHVENLAATSSAAHDFRGNAGNNVVTGGAGNDVLRLQDGGDDTANGGEGNDNIFFIGSLTGADVVNGGDGVDTLVLQGPYGALTLSANVTRIENISILGGDNTAFGEPGTNRHDYVLTTNNANFAAGVQARINGAALLAGEDFTFDGSAETDASYVVYGGKGVDTLTGGLGNDIFFYAEERFASGDTVNGGAGYDGMFLRGNYTIDFNAPGYTGLFTNIENLTLTSATDERYARGGGTEFDYSLTLSDAIVNAGQTLTVSGALLMASETMILDASLEADGFLRLFGGKAGDTLKGGGQADLLLGNLGADILAGNGGADVFRFDSTADSNSASMDHILDFAPGVDKVDLSRIDANTLVAGDQAFTWTGANAFGGTAGELIRQHLGGTDWLVLGDTDGNGAADFAVMITAPPTVPIWVNDFIL